ncbi:MAG: tetratricopeptide repeat protein [Candidatus Omnitrophota bacterium]
MAITDNIKENSQWIDRVQGNFRAAIALDPDMLQAYFFSGVVVANDQEGLEKGIAFLKEGAKQNTKSWQILYWLGFNYYQSGDYLKAAEYYERASNLAGAPKFLKSIQPMQYYKARRADLGVAYLEGLLESVKDPQQLEWIKFKLEWLKNIVILEKQVNQFIKIYGYSPDSLEDLLKMRLIDKIPADPFGAGYYLDKESGRIKSKFGLPGSNK